MLIFHLVSRHLTHHRHGQRDSQVEDMMGRLSSVAIIEPLALISWTQPVEPVKSLTVEKPLSMTHCGTREAFGSRHEVHTLLGKFQLHKHVGDDLVKP